MSKSWTQCLVAPFRRILARTPHTIRRSERLQIERLEDRTTPTSLLSITPSTHVLTDANVGGNFSLTIVFNGQMNTSVAPAVSFPTSGEDPGGNLALAGGVFSTTTVTDDTYTAIFNVNSQPEVLLPNIDVRITGAKDFGNNLVASQTVADVFDISTLNPAVLSVAVNKTPIVASDAGSTFTVTITYSEAMDNTIAPTIAFNQNVSSTLTAGTGSWNNAGTIFTKNYAIANANVVVPSININVTGAKDVDGFTQPSFTKTNAFAIDTSSNANGTFPLGSLTQVSGDFNGDGLTDVAAYYTSNGRWLVSLSTGTEFLAPQTWSTFGSKTGWTKQVVGDFNGDGKDDIANFFNLAGYAEWWVNLSNGNSFTLSRWSSFGSKSGWTRQLVGDFNGDGKDDIANFFNPSGYAEWWVTLSNGSSFTLSRWSNFGTKSGWTKQVVGDFNNDGKDDIANFYNINGYAEWWVVLSDGSKFATTSKFGSMPSTATGWANSLAGDFNKDGKTDIASYNSNTGLWWVSLSNGASFATTQWGAILSTTKWAQVAGDFNHDGRTDVANIALNNGQVGVSSSSGSNFATSLWDTLPSLSGLTTELVGDFNGDGVPDIAYFYAKAVNAEWWVALSNGSSSFTTSRWR